MRPASPALLALSWSILLTSAASARAPGHTVQVSPSAQRPYQERVDVSRLLIDARVVDPSGHPLRDLTSDDFAVKVDGQAAVIDRVEWLPATSPSGADPPNPSTPPPDESSTAGRWIVLFYQKHTDLSDVGGVMRLRTNIGSLTKLLSRRDRIAVVSFDTSFHVWLDFTDESPRIRHIVEHDLIVGTPPREVSSPTPILSVRIPPAIAASTYTIEKSLRLIGDALESLPGAKSIIVLGYGMGTWMPSFGAVEMASDYKDTLQSLESARVSVFCIDVTAADYHPREEGLRQIAEESGGLYLKSHIFTTAMVDRVAGALQGFYTLSLVLPNSAHGERKVDIRLVRRRGDVMARRTYPGTLINRNPR
jgi:VWFA-related protein